LRIVEYDFDNEIDIKYVFGGMYNESSYESRAYA